MVWQVSGTIFLAWRARKRSPLRTEILTHILPNPARCGFCRLCEKRMKCARNVSCPNEAREGFKYCERCLETRRNWDREHKDTIKARQRKDYNANPNKFRDRARDIKLGKGASAHLHEQVKLQNNLCAICGNELEVGKGTHLDHEHISGKYRGALCNLCNALLGYAKDSKETLLKANLYLEKWK